MKKILITVLLFLFCITHNLFAQSALEAPLGLKFGCDRATVKQIIKAKGGSLSSEKATNYGSADTYSDFSIGSQTVYLGIFKFVDNKLFDIGLFIDPISEPNIEKKYKEVCEIIEKKYGKGESFRNFKYPYKDTEEDVLSALRGEYATIISYWTNFSNNDGIIVEIQKLSSLYVHLGYQNGNLTDLAQSKQEKKNNSEF